LSDDLWEAITKDITEMAPLFDKMPKVAGQVGHPKKKPDALQEDPAYDSEPHRQGLSPMGIEPVLPEKVIDDRSGLGRRAGRWNGRWCGSIRTDGFESVMCGGRTSIRHF
jgi:hypothetical protein